MPIIQILTRIVTISSSNLHMASHAVDVSREYFDNQFPCPRFSIYHRRVRVDNRLDVVTYVLPLAALFLRGKNKGIGTVVMSTLGPLVTRRRLFWGRRSSSSSKNFKPFSRRYAERVGTRDQSIDSDVILCLTYLFQDVTKTSDEFAVTRLSRFITASRMKGVKNSRVEV